MTIVYYVRSFQIVDIGMMRVSHEKVTALNDVRQVTLKVDEFPT